MPATLTPSIDTTETGELAARLHLLIARLSRELRQSAPPGVTPSQNLVLVAVAKYGPLTPSEIADRERISRPTVTRLLRRLLDQGLIETVQSPSDGRSYEVQMSAAGRRLRETRRIEKRLHIARALTKLTATERARIGELADLLERAFEVEM